MTAKSRRTRKPVWKRVVLGIFVFLFSFSVLSMAASAVIFQVMFDRQPPPDLSRSMTYADPALDAYPRTTLTFPSGEQALTGFWFEAPEAWGVVLIAHGLGASAERHAAETAYFLDQGLSVFAYDATGMGSSEGDSIVGLAQSKLDVISAVTCLRQLEADLPLFLYGHSMGGYGVLAALEEIEAQAVVCLNGYRSPIRLMHSGAKAYVGLLADIQYPFLCLQNWFTFGADGNTDALSAASAAGIPVLILNASEDEVIPPAAALMPTEEMGDNICFRTVTGHHSGMWLSDAKTVNEDLLTEIVQFYRSAA